MWLIMPESLVVIRPAVMGFAFNVSMSPRRLLYANSPFRPPIMQMLRGWSVLRARVEMVTGLMKTSCCVTLLKSMSLMRSEDQLYSDQTWLPSEYA